MQIQCIICDAPAKSYIKCIKGHTGYYSCSKCCIQGEFSSKMYFPNIDNLVLRTDAHFRSQQDEEHHIGKSILEEIPQLNIINGFPLDYMHLVCLGVTKKLLYLWCFGKPNTKLSAATINAISQSLMDLRTCIPLEFNRKPRSLNEIKMWKATEFRQLLFYTGPLVLKRYLNKDRYLNFLSLHVGLSILASPKHINLIEYSSELLKYFVRTFQTLYDIKNTSHNVHNLLHLTEDVKLNGSVDNFSAFDFENCLQSILKYVRKHDKPLQQIVKRYLEKITSEPVCQEQTIYPLVTEQNISETAGMDNLKSYKTLTFKHFVLKTNFPNNCCTLKNGELIIINNFVKQNNSLNMIGRKYLKKDCFYNNPCHSSEINIFSVSDKNLGPSEHFDVADIYYKCLKLKFEEQYVIMPLLHC